MTQQYPWRTSDSDRYPPTRPEPVPPPVSYQPYPQQASPPHEFNYPQQAGYPPYPQPQGYPLVYQTVAHPVRLVATKSVAVSYLLWFFFGLFGVHHFYLNRTGWGVAYLLATVLLGWFGLGLVLVGIACLIDLFLIPGYTREANRRLTGYRW